MQEFRNDFRQLALYYYCFSSSVWFRHKVQVIYISAIKHKSSKSTQPIIWNESFISWLIQTETGLDPRGHQAHHSFRRSQRASRAACDPFSMDPVTQLKRLKRLTSRFHSRNKTNKRLQSAKSAGVNAPLEGPIFTYSNARCSVAIIALLPVLDRERISCESLTQIYVV